MDIFKNKKFFAISLGIAFFLWFYVKLGFNTRQNISIPLKVVNIPEGYMLVSEVPDHISVQFESDGKSLLALKYFYDVSYELDFSEYKQDSAIYLNHTLHNIRMPAKGKYKIIAVNFTDSLILKTEKIIKKKVPIRPNVKISCEPGFIVVGGLKVKPDSVVVKCPESYADRIHFISTDSAEYDKLNSTESFLLKILPSNDRLIRYTLNEVQVTVNVQPLGEIQMENLPVKIVNLPPTVKAVVQPSTFSIRIRGGVNYLASMPRDSIRGFIDYLQEKKLNRPEPILTIQVPKDITWSQISPNRFKLIELDE